MDITKNRRTFASSKQGKSSTLLNLKPQNKIMNIVQEIQNTEKSLSQEEIEDLRLEIQKLVFAERQEMALNFLEKLKILGLNFSENTMVVIDQTQVTIGLRKDKYDFVFASEFPIYSRTDWGSSEVKNSMNLASSGAFNPSNEASFWRTIHASEVLKNWDAVCEIVNYSCKAYSDFLDKAYSIIK